MNITDKIAANEAYGPRPQSVLQEAEVIINGQRRQDYGSCAESFERIARFWNAYLTNEAAKYDGEIGTDWELTGEDVALMMNLMKVARYQNGGTRDSIVDMAGYAGCVEKIREEEGRRL